MILDKLGRGKISTKKLIKSTECMLKLFNCINHEVYILLGKGVCSFLQNLFLIFCSYPERLSPLSALRTYDCIQDHAALKSELLIT